MSSSGASGSSFAGVPGCAVSGLALPFFFNWALGSAFAAAAAIFDLMSIAGAAFIAGAATVSGLISLVSAAGAAAFAATFTGLAGGAACLIGFEACFSACGFFRLSGFDVEFFFALVRRSCAFGFDVVPFAGWRWFFTNLAAGRLFPGVFFVTSVSVPNPL